MIAGSSCIAIAVGQTLGLHNCRANNEPEEPAAIPNKKQHRQSGTLHSGSSGCCFITKNSFLKPFPQGLKPLIPLLIFGMTEAVLFQNEVRKQLLADPTCCALLSNWRHDRTERSAITVFALGQVGSIAAQPRRPS